MPDPPARTASDRWQLRLAIAVPALLALLMLIYGLFSLTAFSGYWEELEQLGAESIGRQLLWSHLIGMLVLTALALVVGIVLASTILRPMRALGDAIERVGEGRFDLHAPDLDATPELASLSRSFNSMIDHLSQMVGQRDRRLMEGLPIGVLSTDMDGRITALSPVAVEMLGVPAEGLLGRTVDELPGLTPETARPLVRRLNDLTQRYPSAGQPAADAEPNNLSVTASCLRDAHNAPVGMVFSFRDWAPVQDLSDHFEHTDQLATLGAFALGLAHELRNPLGAIKGLSQLLQRERDLSPRLTGYLEHMVHETERVDAFVGQLLELTDRSITGPEPTDLAALVREVVAELAAANDDAMPAVDDRLDPLPELVVERERLGRAFENILRNAIEAAGPAGHIALRTFRRGEGPRNLVGVEIHNDGDAIPPDRLRRVFDPFFTTKDGASGLGLTVARQIVGHNGGVLEAESGPGGVTMRASFDLNWRRDAREPDPARQMMRTAPGPVPPNGG